MSEVNPELIEKYQMMLQRDPKSQVFAPLAEAYRKMGLAEEAFNLCVKGTQYNPNFAGGRISFAKILMARGEYKSASKELEQAVTLSPENIMGYQLQGECQMALKNPKEALRAFKMVLFLSPNHEKAQKYVKTLESLSAEDYDDDLFAMLPLNKANDALEVQLAEPLQPQAAPHKNMRSLERYLSLIDAFMVRNDFPRVESTLQEAEGIFGLISELERRRKILQRRIYPDPIEQKAAAEPPNRKEEIRDDQIELLQKLLKQVQKRSQDPSKSLSNP